MSVDFLPSGRRLREFVTAKRCNQGKCLMCESTGRANRAPNTRKGVYT